MAPVEITPMGGGGQPGTPWARSPREIDETYGVVAVQMEQIAARPQRNIVELSPGEHYAIGIRAAALWTKGELSLAPLTGDDVPADIGAAVKVLAVAEHLMTAESTPGQVSALAAGVRAWLLWLVGADDRMVFRALD